MASNSFRARSPRIPAGLFAPADRRQLHGDWWAFSITPNPPTDAPAPPLRSPATAPLPFRQQYQPTPPRIPMKRHLGAALRAAIASSAAALASLAHAEGTPSLFVSLTSGRPPSKSNVVTALTQTIAAPGTAGRFRPRPRLKARPGTSSRVPPRSRATATRSRASTSATPPTTRPSPQPPEKPMPPSSPSLWISRISTPVPRAPSPTAVAPARPSLDRSG